MHKKKRPDPLICLLFGEDMEFLQVFEYLANEDIDLQLNEYFYYLIHKIDKGCKILREILTKHHFCPDIFLQHIKNLSELNLNFCFFMLDKRNIENIKKLHIKGYFHLLNGMLNTTKYLIKEYVKENKDDVKLPYGNTVISYLERLTALTSYVAQEFWIADDKKIQNDFSSFDKKDIKTTSLSFCGLFTLFQKNLKKVVNIEEKITQPLLNKM